MTESDEARRARVHAVLGAARRIASAHDPLGREARARLPDVTSLSREGVELALTEHLESEADDASIDALLAACGRAPRCHVVLSANVCVAAVRALALALATSPVVLVRPSRRDPVVAELLARALAESGELARAAGSVTLAPALDPAAGDEVHVYGRDETVAAIGASLPAGVVLRAHGAGFGVAVVGASSSLEGAAAALARDVVPFDQRGCLSPRIALVEGDPPRALRFAAALDGALAALGARVPRGGLNEDEHAAIAAYRATLEAVGVVHAGSGHIVGVDPSARALVLPPTGRVVHVVAASPAAASAMVAPLARFVTTLGADDDGSLVSALAHAAPPRAARGARGDAAPAAGRAGGPPQRIAEPSLAPRGLL